jgi:hypothetical protein
MSGFTIGLTGFENLSYSMGSQLMAGTDCFGSAKFGQKLIFSKLRFEIGKPS